MRWAAAALVAAGLCVPRLAHGAQAPAANAVAEAQRLRDAGDLTTAARLLRATLAGQPDNGDAARLLAQTLYWLNDINGAEALYEDSRRRHPEDTTLLLQYGRMLAETGQRARAVALVTPLQARPATEAEANALLGTIAYWDGDLSGARRLFEATLRTSPTHAEAQRQLQDIRAVSAPWVRFTSGFGKDDQPLDRLAVGVEAGWFPTPLVPVTVRVEPLAYRRDDDSPTRRLVAAELVVAHYAPAARLETELAGGAIFDADGEGSSDWKGRAGLGVRLPAHVTLRVRGERNRYLYTTASLETPVMVNSGTALLQWQDPRGWLGEAAYQLQRYPDDNTIRTAYAWQLVPLVYRRAAEVQVGYSFAGENADESRFVLSRPVQPFPPTDPRFSTAGHYDPYFTPSHVLMHSAIAAVAVRPSRGATLRFGGGRAFHATEDAPLFVVSGGQVVETTTPREFSPWNARGSLEMTVQDDLTLTVTAEFGRSAFYESKAAGLQLTYRFRSTP